MFVSCSEKHMCSCPYAQLSKLHIPIQLRPSPMKPKLQVQLNDPSVLTQSAFTGQSWPPSRLHSSISRKRTEQSSIKSVFQTGGGPCFRNLTKSRNYRWSFLMGAGLVFDTFNRNTRMQEKNVPSLYIALVFSFIYRFKSQKSETVRKRTKYEAKGIK